MFGLTYHEWTPMDAVRVSEINRWPVLEVFLIERSMILFFFFLSERYFKVSWIGRIGGLWTLAWLRVIEGKYAIFVALLSLLNWTSFSEMYEII